MEDTFKDHIEVVERRADPDTGSCFAVITCSHSVPRPGSIRLDEHDLLSEEELKPWIQPDVYTRLSNGQGEFLAELRPAVALFFQFGGFQFDSQQEAPKRLDNYIQAVQEIIQRFGGVLIQLTMGDKGSYAYAAFGAPKAHEDDVDRAIAAALELRQAAALIVGPIQIGISQGLMRTGAYGSSNRRTYGVLGDEVNVAARLMQAAGPGQILVSEAAVKQAKVHLDWQAMPDVQAKGKQGIIRVFQPERFEAGSVDHEAPRYSLPMVGRRAEFARLREALVVTQGHVGSLIALTAPAGMGKTRLSYELIRRAHDEGFKVYSGACPSFGTQSSYMVWRPIWRSILGLDESADLQASIEKLEAQLHEINPAYVSRLPLLGSVLNLPIEDNQLTRSFDAKLRKSSLEALLISLLRHEAVDSPILFFLDDLQWIDPLSLDLLSALARASGDLPVFILLTYRDEEPDISDEYGLVELPNFTEIRLDEFSDGDTRALLELKVSQLYGEGMRMPDEIVNQIAGKAQGNPFYVEELLNYLKDRGLDPRQTGALEEVALPTSLASLILSRIDQLEDNQKVTLRLASVIGRIFRASWLSGAFSNALSSEQVDRDLEVLNRLELTQFETLEPEMTYLFKHIVTHEVAYDSLPFATRSELHERLGGFIERAYHSTLDQHLDFLAHHYGLSENRPKKRTYLLRAARASQERYSNKAAIAYYMQALDLVNGLERIDILGELALTMEIVGEWEQAEEFYRQAIEAAHAIGKLREAGRYQAELGEFFRKQGLYDEAVQWWDQAAAVFEQQDDQAGIGKVLHYQGTLAAQQGDYETARHRYGLSLDVRTALDDAQNIANLMNNLGVVARMEGDYQQALTYQERALEIRRALDDRRLIAISLNNLGNLYADLGELTKAQAHLEEALTLQREVGDRWAIANCLNNLANALIARGELEAAANMYLESLRTNQELGDRWGLAYLLEDVGRWACLGKRVESAIRMISAAGAHRQRIGAPRSAAEQHKLDESLSAALVALSTDQIEDQKADGRALPLEDALALARTELERATDGTRAID
jgi:predicted ATPase